jgi:hypothetical protein
MTATFLVSGAHMRVVVAAFFEVHGESFQLRYSGLPVRGRGDAITLGQSLFAMNAEAAKIGRAPRDVLTSYLSIPFHELPRRLPPARLYKAVECLEVQCRAGEVPRDWALYRDLGALACSLARRVVTETPEYQTAPWHIDRALTMAKG